MSPSSSISSSEHRRYAGALLGAVLLLSIAVVALTYAGLRQGVGSEAWVQLLKYQSAKLSAHPAGVETVFVGDSSLGNAVDAAVWAAESGAPGVSLALTGSFGLGGTFNMLRHANEALRPKVIVIMQTADLMTRAFDYQGYIQTATRQELREVPIRELLRAFMNWDNLRSALKAFAREEPGLDVFENDYIRQAAPMGPEAVRRALAKLRLRPASIQEGHELFLARIGRYCRTHELVCVYAHGPLLEGACQTATAYFTEVNSRIRTAGIPVLQDTPLCLPAGKIGDALDHVRPRFKAEVTRRYHALARPFVDTARKRSIR